VSDGSKAGRRRTGSRRPRRAVAAEIIQIVVYRGSSVVSLELFREHKEECMGYRTHLLWIHVCWRRRAFFTLASRQHYVEQSRNVTSYTARVLCLLSVYRSDFSEPAWYGSSTTDCFKPHLWISREWRSEEILELKTVVVVLDVKFGGVVWMISRVGLGATTENRRPWNFHHSNHPKIRFQVFRLTSPRIQLKKHLILMASNLSGD
jgi:hypothetical protein